MLLTFPELLTFSIFAPLVLRLALAAFFLVAGSERLSPKHREPAIQKLQTQWPSIGKLAVWYTGIIEIALALLFAVGFLTQIAGIVGVIYAVKLIVIRELKTNVRILAQYDIFIYIFIFAASLALTVLGAGALGVDLPL